MFDFDKVILSLTVMALLVLCISNYLRDTPSFYYNGSQSADIGWYKIAPSKAYSSDDIVVAILPDDARTLADERGYLPRDYPVIKTIGGVAGDRYCVTDTQLQIENGPDLQIFPFDSQGREMPVLQAGCVDIRDGHVLLISERIDRSFDSRYFGEVAVDQIIGEVRYIGMFDGSPALRISDMGGARGLGADGKIKEASAFGPLLPCLHINFQGARNFCLAPIFSHSSMLSTILGSANSLFVPKGHEA